ncbi:MAG: NAD-dependent epimerase/dehydratase family protein [Caulobacteraceae bacterium]
MAGETVLVTGGSGFIGSWCVIELLRRGYQVRTTVRDLGREGEVRAMIGSVADTANLSVYAANLTADTGWDEAVAGCEFVLHVASPVAAAEPKDPDDLIVPAREGAVRVVSAAVRAGVRRVVMTSSVASIGGGFDGADGVFDETTWTDGDDPKVSAYARPRPWPSAPPGTLSRRPVGRRSSPQCCRPWSSARCSARTIPTPSRSSTGCWAARSRACRASASTWSTCATSPTCTSAP